MKYWKIIKHNPPQLNTLKIKNGVKLEPIFYDSETSKITHTEVKGKGKNQKTIEIVDDTWVYLWMCSIGDQLYYGRYLHEFFELLQWLINFYEISPERKIDIWIHNASYDVSYMYDLIFQLNGGTENMTTLWSAPRQLISWELDNIGITIKCTYRLTNRSLAKWCSDLGVEHVKQTGTKDYDTTYKPSDKLPKNEYKYGAYDIISMKECFYKELELQGYNFANCPLTQTGFVRKDFQKQFAKKGEYFVNKKEYDKTHVNTTQYDRLTRAAAGGMVAGNYKNLGVKIVHEQGIGHADFSSHYPTQQKIRLYPQKPTTIREDGQNIGRLITFKELDFYVEKKYYYVIDIVLGDVTLKKEVTAPFMSESKLMKGKDSKVYAVNGKVTAIKGEARICCTNFDLDIFREQYDIKWYSVKALDIYTTKKLPKYILDIVDKYYIKKAELKKAVKKDPKNTDLKASYMISKQKLNGIFGCMYTRSIRPEITISQDFEYDINYDNSTLEDYYDRYNTCLAFQWGVFTTALARYELYTVIRDVVGYEAFLYCDTDSVFYRNSPEIEKRLQEYRDRCKNDSEKNGYFVTLEDGSIEYYHDLSPEDDHLKSKTFKALHAKCYALEPDGNLECTIAGVAAKSKDETVSRETELGSIDEFKEGKEFILCGGTRADYSTIREYEGYTGGGCAILSTTKTIGGTEINLLDLESEVFKV